MFNSSKLNDQMKITQNKLGNGAFGSVYIAKIDNKYKFTLAKNLFIDLRALQQLVNFFGKFPILFRYYISGIMRT